MYAVLVSLSKRALSHEILLQTSHKRYTKRMNKLSKARRGFTVVELTIVIVVIGILTSITMISYGTYQRRTQIATAQNDLKAINNALEKYYSKNGAYPISTLPNGAAYVYRAELGEAFIPGLVPNYIKTTNDVMYGDKTYGRNNTFAYRSNGRDYKLLRLAEAGKSFDDTELKTIGEEMQDTGGASPRWTTTTKRGYGYWTPGAAAW